jgi:hypothetical protein
MLYNKTLYPPKSKQKDVHKNKNGAVITSTPTRHAAAVLPQPFPVVIAAPECAPGLAVLIALVAEIADPRSYVGVPV